MLMELSKIVDLVVESLLHVWPYLVITIPISVAVNMSGASAYIGRALKARPLVAVLLATAVGAFSPFCSCGVIPVVAALLIGGVPLAPVMSFWIASPSMDPEIFFLSVSMIGWDLAVWRLGATLLMSLGAGYLTHFLITRDLLGRPIIMRPVKSYSATATPKGEKQSCQAQSDSNKSLFTARLLTETWKATWLVIKFMSLAFLLQAIIKLYLPSVWITSLLGSQNSWAIPAAATLGVPTYTGNLMALPMISGLLNQGMDPAAALAFLISGPATTLPAMAAVWGIVNRRVFIIYVLTALIGGLLSGYAYKLITFWT
jgi:hypothetical protein